MVVQKDLVTSCSGDDSGVLPALDDMLYMECVKSSLWQA